MDIIQSVLDNVDLSFKWILLAMNFMTIVIVYLFKRKNKRPKQHNILFVTAHPDDESMFFRPIIDALVDTYFVHLLCLSGKGTKREQELSAACKYLKINKHLCIGDEKLTDGLKQKWCEETIKNYACSYIKENKIKAVFTFDKYGISDHPNHKAIHSAIKDLQTKPPQTQNTKTKEQSAKQQQSDQQQKQNKAIKVYYLQSVSLIRKYTGLLQAPIALMKTFSWLDFSSIRTYRAMKAHASQFVWYRQIWVWLSRYSYINSYRMAYLNTDHQKNA